ncbi:hypothetical protein Palpr_0180 [Paludibacter propionicigenes WB4]|uniref:Uncharacterized protein n=1 Tax=Paludibacter propionicigenes (strain DSM 17365 / JCM 13257 / WB4) TaxID=694427 RepID=E4T0I3_PALPW|nr:hypothetical protein [Paludibacter propionicigenes]ADQ78342.1 hypothetical protein Palpr_0180 [Paludibacter propionicigenes WB4]
MKTSIGSGHEHNVTNFNTEISCILTFGPQYNPSVSALTLSELNRLYQQGVEVNRTVKDNEIALDNATAARANKFEGFDDTVTRIINAVRICGTTPQIIDQAESIVRELRAKRASTKPTDEELAAEKAKGNNVRQVTLHKGTFERKIVNFEKLQQLLNTIPSYLPNERELSVNALNSSLTEYKALNDAVVTAQAALDASDIVRRALLYTEGTGLIDVALAAKQYVKSVFGATSPQYKQISNIPFTRPK